MSLRIVPLTFREACDFIARHHRHHKPPRGMKFCIGVEGEGGLVGVVTAGRPVARAYDPKAVLEVNRTCTDGTRNANSMLYGAARRTGVGMGYAKIITYIQKGESGESLRGAGFRKEQVLPARESWAEASVALRAIRDPVGAGGVDRERWVWP